MLAADDLHANFPQQTQATVTSEEVITDYKKVAERLQGISGQHGASLQREVDSLLENLRVSCRQSEPSVEPPFSTACALLLKAASLACIVCPFSHGPLHSAIETVVAAAPIEEVSNDAEAFRAKVDRWIRALDAKQEPRHLLYLGVYQQETARSYADSKQALTTLTDLNNLPSKKVFITTPEGVLQRTLTDNEWRAAMQRFLLLSSQVHGIESAAIELARCKRWATFLELAKKRVRTHPEEHLNLRSDCPWERVAQLPMSYTAELVPATPLWDWRHGEQASKLRWVSKLEAAHDAVCAELAFLLDENGLPKEGGSMRQALKLPARSSPLVALSTSPINRSSTRGVGWGSDEEEEPSELWNASFVQLPLWTNGRWHSGRLCALRSLAPSARLLCAF